MPQVNQEVRGAVITGWGSALPTKVLTNHDLEDMFETDHNWIVERTGIHERRVGGMTSDLSIESGRAALEMSGVNLDAIDALILATTTPDRSVPATASTVQAALGLHCGAFDVNAACSGWVYGLVTAHGLIAMGAEKILLIGTDTLSRITDWDDRNTAILFADGSAATVLEAVDGPGQMLGWDLDSDGTLPCGHCRFVERAREPSRHRSGQAWTRPWPSWATATIGNHLPMATKDRSNGNPAPAQTAACGDFLRNSERPAAYALP